MQYLTAIPARALRAAVHAACPEKDKDIRFYLKAVLIEFTAGVLHVVGCDGSVLFACQFPGHPSNLGGDWELLIPISTVNAVLKLHGKARHDIPLHGEPGFDKACQLGNIAFTSVAGKFPDWRRVTPARGSEIETGEPANYAPINLSRCYWALAEHDEVSKAKADFHCHMHRLKSVAVITGGAPNAYAVVMPYRIHNREPQSWFTPVTAQKKAA